MPYPMQVFETDDHRELRTVVIDGEPWFVLTDVCRALDMQSKKGYYGHHAEKLDDDQKRVIARSDISRNSPPIAGEGNEAVPGNQATVISESGLYTFVLRSDKPEAKRLRKWVTSVVLPSIRKTGSYSGTADASLAQWQPFHDRISLTLTKVPEGYFCIFKEMADLTAQLITQGATVNDETVPDISLGIAWAKEWELKGHEHDFGPRTRYEHSYPSYFRQARSNPQWVWCYPEESLGVFRRWMRNSYLPTAYPKYLASKEKKGDIPALVVQAAIKAVEAARPKPLR